VQVYFFVCQVLPTVPTVFNENSHLLSNPSYGDKCVRAPFVPQATPLELSAMFSQMTLDRSAAAAAAAANNPGLGLGAFSQTTMAQSTAAAAAAAAAAASNPLLSLGASSLGMNRFVFGGLSPGVGVQNGHMQTAGLGLGIMPGWGEFLQYVAQTDVSTLMDGLTCTGESVLGPDMLRFLATRGGVSGQNFYGM